MRYIRLEIAAIKKKQKRGKRREETGNTITEYSGKGGSNAGKGDSQEKNEANKGPRSRAKVLEVGRGAMGTNTS